ncbi:MAG: 4,5-DOPA-extradiol-dioxygenase [Paludibacteraceae bacterium]
MTQQLNQTMPAIFVGHGSPMNAIETNSFTETWKKLGETIPKPELIICISAHWETRGTYITSMPHPRTIHDFGGFPEELYEVQYPAPGYPEFAEKIVNDNPGLNIKPDNHEWGFDHGSWSVIKHFYPKADIPMIQLSIDHLKTFQQHYDLAQKLSYLRNEGVLIIGSGNIVHNLRAVDWNNPESGYDWAAEVTDKVKQWILEKNYGELLNITQKGGNYRMAIPTPEHYIPLLYILAMQNNDDKIDFFCDELSMGSLSMTGVLLSQ